MVDNKTEMELQTRKHGKSKAGKQRRVKIEDRFREFLQDNKTSGVRKSMQRLIDNGFKFFSDKAEKRIIQAHNYTISSMVYEPKTKILATADDGSAILFWNTAEGKAEKAIPSDSMYSLDVAFGAKRVLAGGDKNISMWDLATGEKLWSSVAHTDEVSSVFFAPDFKTFFSFCKKDKKLNQWNVEDGKVIKTISTLDNARHIVQSPDRERLIIAFKDGATLRVISTRTPSQQKDLAVRPPKKKLNKALQKAVTKKFGNGKNSDDLDLDNLSIDDLNLDDLDIDNDLGLDDLSLDDADSWGSSWNDKDDAKDDVKEDAKDDDADADDDDDDDDDANLDEDEVSPEKKSGDSGVKPNDSVQKKVGEKKVVDDERKSTGVSSKGAKWVDKQNDDDDDEDLSDAQASDPKAGATYSFMSKLAVCPDNRTVFAGLEDGKVLLIDFIDLKFLKVLTGAEGEIKELSVKQDNSRLAYLDDDDQLFIWNTQAWKLRHKHENVDHVAEANDAEDDAATPERLQWTGESLAISYDNYSLRTIDPDTNKLVKNFQGHRASMVNAHVDPENPSLIYSADSEGTVKRWNLANASEQKSQKLMDYIEKFVLCPSDWSEFGEDERFLLIADDNQQFFLYDASTFKQHKKTFKTKLEWISEIQVLEEAYMVAASDEDGVHLFNISEQTKDKFFPISGVDFFQFTTEKLYAFPNSERMEIWDREQVKMTSEMFDGLIDGRIASVHVHEEYESVFLGLHGEIKLFNYDDKSLTKTFSGHDGSIGKIILLDEDYEYFASSSGDGTVRVWSIDSGVQESVLSTGIDENFTQIQTINVGGQVKVMGSSDDSIALWRLRIGTHDKQLTLKDSPKQILHVDIEKSDVIIGSDEGMVHINVPTNKRSDILKWGNAADFLIASQSCSKVAVAFEDSVKIFTISQNPQLLSQFEGEDEEVSALLFDQEENFLLIGTDAGNVHIIDIKTGFKTRSIPTTDRVTSLLVTKDNLLYVGHVEGLIKTFVYSSGELKASIDVNGEVYTMVLVPDNADKMVCHVDCNIFYLDIKSGVKEREMYTAVYTVSPLIFHRNNTKLFTAGDKKFMSWDVESGTIDMEYRGPQGDVVDFKPFGENLMIVLDDNPKLSVMRVDNPKSTLRTLDILKNNMSNHKDLLSSDTSLFGLTALFPFEATILHVLVYLNRLDDIKKYFALAKEGRECVPFKHDIFRRTPLDVALEDKNQAIMAVLIDYIKTIETPNIIAAFASTTCALMKQMDIADFDEFIDSRLIDPVRRDEFPDKAQFDTPRQTVCQDFFLTQGTYGQLVVNAQGDSEKKEVSVAEAESDIVEEFINIKMIDVKGLAGYDSTFLPTIVSLSPDHDVFQSQVLELILDHKWNAFVKWRVWISLIVYLAFTFIFCVYIGHGIDEYDHESTEKNIFLGSFVIYWIYLAHYEAKQMLKFGFTAYYDLWNIADLIRLLFLAASIISDYSEGQTSTTTRVLYSLANFMIWTKVMFFLRAFKSTGAMINMIIQTVSDMKGFLLIICITLVSTTFSLYVLFRSDESKTLLDFFGSSFTMLLGDFDTEAFETETYSSTLEWLIFIFYMIYMVIILLNMLIAIMSDTFDRVKDSWQKSRNYEFANIIHEEEYSMNRAPNQHNTQYYPNYLYVSTLAGADGVLENDVWEGRVKEIVKTNKKMFETQGEKLTTLEDNFAQFRVKTNQTLDTLKDLSKITIKELKDEIRRSQEKMSEEFKAQKGSK